jgi:hypothetical protein
MAFSESEREKLCSLLAAGTPLPAEWLPRLFPAVARQAQVGKEYRLVYDGKLTREEVLAQTPAAPWQIEREFCTGRPHPATSRSARFPTCCSRTATCSMRS